jgi:hypothetical protein
MISLRVPGGSPAKAEKESRSTAAVVDEASEADDVALLTAKRDARHTQILASTAANRGEEWAFVCDISANERILLNLVTRAYMSRKRLNSKRADSRYAYRWCVLYEEITTGL